VANLEHYRIFCKIADCGSISKAADQLFVSQPAVSLTIKQLEGELGVALFARTQRGVNLTPEGELLYSFAKQGVNYLRTGEEKMKELNLFKAGSLRVGASDMTIRFFLLPFIEKFRERYPLISIKLTNITSPSIIKRLRDGMIDFGLISGPIDDRDEKLEYIKLRQIQDVVVASDAFLILKERLWHPSQLTKYPFIMLDRNTNSRAYIEQYLIASSAQIEPDIELASSDLIVEMALRGMGLGVVSEDFASGYIASGRLFTLQLDPPVKPRNLYLIKMRGAAMSAASQRFLQSMPGGAAAGVTAQTADNGGRSGQM